MNSKLLLEGEEIISQSNDKQVTLTTYRVYYDSSQFGKAHTASIMLEKISSVEIHYSSWILFLILGGLFAIAGLACGANNQGPAMMLGLAIAAVLILFYFLTRKHVVTIASDGGAKINFRTKGIKREAIIDFMNQVDKAKNNRYK
ncbi:hypothetical protein LBMAG27_25240 [Bacteroidota bacterium]|nr:hypothetical protein LBMAG27_25240 [Bacteroidota bacterium]